MPRAIKIPAINEWMKQCSHCGTLYVGNRLVEVHFGRNRRTADGHTYDCADCRKVKRDSTRARGKGFLQVRKQLTGCENPLCTCTPSERAMREAVLEFHHLDPAVKTFSLAHGTERSLREMIEEAHKTICLCKWSHDQTKGYRGQLSEYGQRLPVAVAERLDAFSANRVVGAGPTYLREDQPQTGNV